jgi:hypothetical protein
VDLGDVIVIVFVFVFLVVAARDQQPESGWREQPGRGPAHPTAR